MKRAENKVLKVADGVFIEGHVQPNTKPGTKNITKIWSIKGVPLIIQTNISTKILSGLNLDIDSKAIISPRGRERAKVNAKSKTVDPKPSNSLSVTCANDINYLLISTTRFVNSYFVAKAETVPSTYEAAKASLTFTVISLPFLNPTA